MVYLVHLSSKELANLRPFGRFWRGSPPDGSFIFDHDEKITFTTHKFLADINTDTSKISSAEMVYDVLGRSLDPYGINTNETLLYTT